MKAERPSEPFTGSTAASTTEAPKPSSPGTIPIGEAAHSAPLPASIAREHDHAAGLDNDADAPPPSRLSGLRKLVSALRERTEQSAPPPGEVPDYEPRFERATKRPAYPEREGPDAEILEGNASAQLTAQPEFLPPRPFVEVETKKEPVRPTAPRRVNPDPDEVQTLPSWRGQYRKKRYPPV